MAVGVHGPESPVTGLVPRYWALERVEAWLGAEDSQIFLVTGAPGTGKTLLSAQLARLRDAVPRAGDDGADAVVKNPDPFVGGVTIIQAKHYKNVVGVSHIRELAGAMEEKKAGRAILVTTSRPATGSC